MRVTDEMVAAFGEAWHATPPSVPGARRRAGIAAALALVELDGLTVHLPMPLDKDGNGPADAADTVEVICWCRDGADCTSLKGA